MIQALADTLNEIKACPSGKEAFVVRTQNGDYVSQLGWSVDEIVARVSPEGDVQILPSRWDEIRAEIHALKERGREIGFELIETFGPYDPFEKEMNEALLDSPRVKFLYAEEVRIQKAIDGKTAHLRTREPADLFIEAYRLEMEADDTHPITERQAFKALWPDLDYYSYAASLGTFTALRLDAEQREERRAS